MLKVVTVAQMRVIEAAADAAGISYDTMMQRAGGATARRVLDLLTEQQIADPRITVLVGPGNNGGDGLVAAHALAQEGHVQVRVYQLAQRDETDPLLQAVRAAGVAVADASNDQQHRVLRQMIASSDIVLDALFGIGLRLPLRDVAVKLLRSTAQAIHERNEQPAAPYNTPHAPGTAYQIPRLQVIAVDCPSGLDSDSGEIDRHSLPADETITFIAAKAGLLLFPGAAHTGRLHVSTLGIPDDLPALSAESCVLADSAYVRTLLPARAVDSNKGTFGKALLVAGSGQYIGAPALAAQACYRAGAGLVTIGAPAAVISALAGHLPEPTWLTLPDVGGSVDAGAIETLRAHLNEYDALLIGPGWGRAQTTRTALFSLLETLRQLPIPVVIDADGLNLLADTAQWWQLLPTNSVLTPHPGEMARLCGMDTAEVVRQRWTLTRDKAREWGSIVLLKGAHTLVAAPTDEMTVMPFKTDALATAGSGDVLAGIITGLLAQGTPAYRAAVAGAYLHGLAGETAAKQAGSTRSVIASDITGALGATFKQIERL